jgi:hypothetical protein
MVMSWARRARATARFVAADRFLEQSGYILTKVMLPDRAKLGRFATREGNAREEPS